MNMTHAWLDPTTEAWPATFAAPNGSSGHRMEGFSAGDRSLLARAFPLPQWSRPGQEPPADPMGRFSADAEGTIAWIPPFLSCGYHDPAAISVEIDAEYGGGFVTRPALPSVLCESEVLHRLVRQARTLAPLGRIIKTADVHAVRITGGSRWTQSAIAPARAMVAVLIARPTESPMPRPGLTTWMPPKLRRPFDAIVWTGPGCVPNPDEVIEGGSGYVLLIAFRG
jgi:hypothetical protein